jgi:hypothetical protein
MCECELELTEYEIRVDSLKLAVELAGRLGQYPDDAVKVAEQFFAFLMKSAESEPKPESEVN